MYKKSSHRTGGGSPYGWDKNYYRDPITSQDVRILSNKKWGKIHREFRGKRKPPSEEELQKLIDDFYKKKPK